MGCSSCKGCPSKSGGSGGCSTNSFEKVIDVEKLKTFIASSDKYVNVEYVGVSKEQPKMLEFISTDGELVDVVDVADFLVSGGAV